MSSDFNKANQLKKEGKLDEAIAAYQQSIELNPNFSWSHHNLGEALAQIGEFEKAVNAYQEAIEAIWYLFLRYKAFRKAVFRSLTTIRVQKTEKF